MGSNLGYFYGGVDHLVALHRTLTEGGVLAKRLFRPPPGLVGYEAPKLSLPREGERLLKDVRRRLGEEAGLAPPNERGLLLAFRTALSRALLEREKLKAALPLLEGLLGEGWHVLLFLQYWGERVLDLSTEEAVLAYLGQPRRGYLGEKGETTKGVLAPKVARALEGLFLEVESPLELVEAHFRPRLGEALAYYTGRESEGALRKAKEAWDRGEVRLLVATGAKGGIGLSFHDTKGGRPTAQVVLTLPWTAIELDQILGRTVRYGVIYLGLKSEACRWHDSHG